MHQNGQLIISPAYTQRLGVQPGDEFEIKLGYKHIQLRRVGSSSLGEWMKIKPIKPIPGNDS